MRTLETLLKQLDNNALKTVAVAQAADREVLKAVNKAIENNLCRFLLVGEQKEVERLAGEVGLTLNHPSIEVLDSNQKEVAAVAVNAVKTGRAQVVMKGNISTKEILKAVLHKEYGLRTGNVLSHVALFEIPNQDRLIFLTDSAMNIAPSLEEKAQIIENTVSVARSLGIEQPKVAVLAAVEVVNPSMTATMDGALLTQMAKRGQLKNCQVDGPLAFDNAVSIKAAEQKGIISPVAGKADVLVAPAIETANALYKSFMYFANAKVAGIISGAAAPIVLTSRADSAESKIYSLALALLSSDKH
ncbi:phosphate butyryltransferase [Thalassobacillus devorans]|uniref:Phosphate butyryltransferase n=1 Tax=Thalassobacillus devorans TaxID=279813 RepID=A0ABQ1P5S9_9BACI|nr:phosphate butyryltransferase [Thalassobacillus devorans]NIK29579.1 phosphate butyryltransferase [Thalassobacillus devorans]GGC91161.1 phosphate butyryltransferase [Thalassobacillus devorans]